MIGLLGPTGAVGTAAAAHLAGWTTSPVRLGARRPRAGMVPVDVDDPAALAAFCRGCTVVLNCAGPAFRIERPGGRGRLRRRRGLRGRGRRRRPGRAAGRSWRRTGSW
ncbi:hypothetical protein MRQ36_29320 [Micromonospora sp. R77]|uniref:hypothetical protein n=1 Tax=Micromonospora sp. R77 TaxID=2925836 RepID=UPI001F605DFF|nr:hypothetical protein [Micromonospora sp. R77]MCI4066434.1 hypothetical protein [Micromonospora sp. R77]